MTALGEHGDIDLAQSRHTARRPGKQSAPETGPRPGLIGGPEPASRRGRGPLIVDKMVNFFVFISSDEPTADFVEQKR